MSYLRVLPDTNIYGILAETESPIILQKLENSQKIIIYGFAVIRRELRDTPKNLLLNRKKFRNTLLSYYNILTKGRNLNLTNLVEALAKEYACNYSGGISKTKLKEDFLIVACATLNHLDIVVSDDNHSMFSNRALAAYLIVNSENGLKTPNFYSIAQLEKLL